MVESAVEPVARLIHRHELGELLQLYKFLQPDDPELNVGELGELWDAILNDEWMKVVVVEADGRLASSCIITMVKNLTRSARPYGLIENVVTHPDFRRRGYGRLVLQQAVEYARARNAYKVMLLTSSKDPAVHHFYERCGFHKGIKTGFLLPIPLVEENTFRK